MILLAQVRIIDLILSSKAHLCTEVFAAAATAAFDVPGFFAADCRPEKNEVDLAMTCLGAANVATLDSGTGFLTAAPILGAPLDVGLPLVDAEATFFSG